MVIKSSEFQVQSFKFYVFSSMFFISGISFLILHFCLPFDIQHWTFNIQYSIFYLYKDDSLSWELHVQL